MPFSTLLCPSSAEARLAHRNALGLAVAFGCAALFLCTRAPGAEPQPAAKGGLPPAARDFLPKDRLYPVPFAPGETLVFTVAWLKVEGGEMTLVASRETTPDGVPVHHVWLHAESNDYVSKFYPVRTQYETWVDARDFQPLRFEKRAREGRYVSDEVEEFDLTRRIGSWRDDRTPLPERVQDIISSFYYLRAQPLVPGTDVKVDMFSRGKVYKLSVAVLGKEPVETEAGTFEAIKVQPQLREGESGEDQNKGKLFLWISDDPRRLLVMARTLMPIGSVTARLKRAVPGQRPAGAPGAPAAAMIRPGFAGPSAPAPRAAAVR
jgi:hypothetical protein